MSNIEVAKRFADLVEAKDLIGLQVILAEDFTGKGPSMQLNKQQTVGYLKILFTAFPDMSFRPTDFEEKGGLISCTSHESGTHTGVLDLNHLGLPVSFPPTGKTFTLPEGRLLFRVANEKVVYFSEEVSEGGGFAGIMAQLGVELA